MNNNQKTFTKNIQEELHDFLQAPLKIKTFIVIIAIVALFIPYNEIFRIPELKDKINNLENERSQKISEIQRLETQLTPFKTIALEKFTGDENQRLQKLAQEIRTLRHDVIAIRDYSDMASLNAFGKPYADGDIIFNTPISRILEGTWEKRENQAIIKIDNEAEEKYREVIRKFPKFPFAYYFLVLCLKDRNNEGWKDYATKAIKILEITTSISGHQQDHDKVLQRLYGFLNET